MKLQFGPIYTLVISILKQAPSKNDLRITAASYQGSS